MLFPIALALSAVPVGPPRTVNGANIGTAEQFRRDGPAAICLEVTRIQLLKGESSYLDYLGIHSGSVVIVGPRGSVKVSEGDIFSPQKGRTIVRTDVRRVDRVGTGRKVRYSLWATPEWSKYPVPRVWIQGDALNGSSDDLALIQRVTVGQSSPADCDQRFDYGWDTLLGPGN